MDAKELARRRGDYGVDAPYVPAAMIAGGLALAAGGVYLLAGRGGSFGLFFGATWMLASAASFLYTTYRGKHLIWAEILSALDIADDARVLDLGCGRGAVLLMAARLVPRGRAAGIDLWSRKDQSGNAEAITRENAAREQVADRVDLHTGDMRALPFADQSFDLVVSSLAIHNIPAEADRLRAIDEAARVLAPGGRIAIADFRHVGAYAETLRARGLDHVRERSLGWRYWYGGPWTATRLVTARKPG